MTSQWDSISWQVAALVPDIACCVLIRKKRFSTLQNNLVFMWDKCWHLMTCLHLMEPHLSAVESSTLNSWKVFIVRKRSFLFSSWMSSVECWARRATTWRLIFAKFWQPSETWRRESSGFWWDDSRLCIFTVAEKRSHWNSFPSLWEVSFWDYWVFNWNKIQRWIINSRVSFANVSHFGEFRLGLFPPVENGEGIIQWRVCKVFCFVPSFDNQLSIH